MLKYSEIINSSIDGVVLISFGTMLDGQHTPESLKNAILKAVSNWPHVTFIWKYEYANDIAAKTPQNAVFKNRIPQMALLGNLQLIATTGRYNFVH
jgi:hypothetical protein